jgi:PIN domain nuclease of toxin-antitoxin system
MLNLDTHILLFALSNEDLTAKESRVLAKDGWSISAIVLWEIAKLAQLKRIDIDLNDREVTRILSRVHVWPVDLPTCIMSTQLDFRSDPADEFIAATSLVHDIPLLTRDQRIRKSKLLRFA